MIFRNLACIPVLLHEVRRDIVLVYLVCVWPYCLLISLYSKLQSDALREAISSIFTDSNEKKRKFTETIELQIGLKNYDPQKDKRFSGSVKLPHIPRPKMKICMLGDASHVEEVILLTSSYTIMLIGVNKLNIIS